MSDIPELERIVFYQGELLTADDLTTQDSNNRELRWLHNRSLHNWGIGFGLDVQGSRGATSVTVNPGYAVDIQGREIILSNPVQQPIPAVPGESSGAPAIYYVVANYVDDADEPVAEQRSAAACAAGGAVRLSNAPAILWKTMAQLSHGIDVVLGQVSIQNCVLSQGVSGVARRYAASGSGFAIQAGQTPAKDLFWKLWQPGGVNFGFTADVDTSAAKFQSTPHYQVQIVGSRSVTGKPSVVIVDLESIANAAPSKFTLQVALPPNPHFNPSFTVAGFKQLVTDLNWIVSWMGVEA
jgi:hypothetical protein